VYIRYFWQGNHQIYGHIRCIYTVLANPIYTPLCELQVRVQWMLPLRMVMSVYTPLCEPQVRVQWMMPLRMVMSVYTPLCELQVRVQWMLPLRMVMSVCYGFWYMQAGKQHPWIRSVAVNLCGLAVNTAMELRYRRLYAQHVQRHASTSLGPAQQLKVKDI